MEDFGMNKKITQFLVVLLFLGSINASVPTDADMDAIAAAMYEFEIEDATAVGTIEKEKSPAGACAAAAEKRISEKSSRKGRVLDSSKATDSVLFRLSERIEANHDRHGVAMKIYSDIQDFSDASLQRCAKNAAKRYFEIETAFAQGARMVVGRQGECSSVANGPANLLQKISSSQVECLANCGWYSLINASRICREAFDAEIPEYAIDANKEIEWMEAELVEELWNSHYGALADGRVIHAAFVDISLNPMNAASYAHEYALQGFITNVAHEFASASRGGRSSAFALFINTGCQDEQYKVMSSDVAKKDLYANHWFTLVVSQDVSGQRTYTLMDSAGTSLSDDRADGYFLNRSRLQDPNILAFYALVESEIKREMGRRR